MKLPQILISIVLLFTVSCASNSPKGDYVVYDTNAKGEEVKVAYGGRCAYSVSQGNLKQKGISQFKHKTEGGRVYYFENQDAKNKFLKSQTRMQRLADRNWDDYVGRRGEY